MEPACTGIVEEMTNVLTMGFHRDTQSGNEKKEKKRETESERVRAICTVTIICVYENLGTIEELEENSLQHEGPAVCICYRGFVPLKRRKGYKATSIR